MGILLGISFLLHLLTILAVVVLYQRRSLQRANLPSMKEDVETIHQSMEAFIDEIEKENELLYKRMIEHLRENELHLRQEIKALEAQLAAAQKPEVSSFSQQNIASEEHESNVMFTNRESIKHVAEQKDLLTKGSLSQKQEINVPLNSIEPNSIEPFIHNQEVDKHEAEAPERSTETKFKQAKDLYMQGFSVEQIAKVLQIGKGEAALIVNMMEKTKGQPR